MIYQKPTTLAEALALRAGHPLSFAVLSGGTDLMVLLRQKKIVLEGIIDISSLSPLKQITVEEHVLEIGAATPHAAIAADPEVQRTLPALAMACRSIGSVQIRNRGTIGGNVMNASPAGDTLPALAAYETSFLAQDLTGERWISFDDFFLGYRETALRPQELLTRIRIQKPASRHEQSVFYKVGTRRAQAISKVSLCVRGAVAHGGIQWIRIAVGSVAPIVIRAYGTEALLAGKAITPGLIEHARQSLADEVQPIDDIRSNAAYRRFAAGGLLARYFRELTVHRTAP